MSYSALKKKKGLNTNELVFLKVKGTIRLVNIYGSA